MFLAFPAILPATLTLIEKEQSERQAEHDDEGAVIGAASLAAFAVVGWWGLDHLGAAASLTAAAGAWLVSACAGYLLTRAVLAAREGA